MLFLLSQIEALKQEITKVQNELSEMKAKYDAAEKRHAERKGLDVKRHSEEIVTLRKINQQLKVK